MKKGYIKPIAEVVKFQYRDQVVAASSSCVGQWLNANSTTDTGCSCGKHEFVTFLN